MFAGNGMDHGHAVVFKVLSCVGQTKTKRSESFGTSVGIVNDKAVDGFLAYEADIVEPWYRGRIKPIRSVGLCSGCCSGEWCCWLDDNFGEEWERWHKVSMINYW